jgi:hypothetical protein
MPTSDSKIPGEASRSARLNAATPALNSSVIDNSA